MEIGAAISILVSIVGAGAAGYWLGRRHAPLPSPQTWLRSLHESWLAGVDARKDALLVVDGRGIVDRANRAAEAWFGAERWALAQRPIIELVRSEDRAALDDTLHAARRAPGSMLDLEVRINVRESEVWVALRLVSLDDDPVVRGTLISIVDAKQGRDGAEGGQHEHATMRAIFDAVPIALDVKSLDGRYVASNRANTQRLGLAHERDVIGKSAHDVMAPELAERIAGWDRAAMASGEAVSHDTPSPGAPSHDGGWVSTTKVPLKDADGRVTGILGVTTDITERKRVERSLAEQAAQDVLTGLPNRRSLMERLATSIEQARAQGTPLAVVFCDLDFFKAINDLHGHDFGDQLLHAIAQSIRARLRPTDWAARFGGDEFVVVCHPLADAAEGLRIADELLQMLRAPVSIGAHTLRVDASIGLAYLHAQHRKASDLLRDADAAMYLAKERGRNRVAVFDDELRQKSVQRSRLDLSLRGAIERSELSLVYQPKVSLVDGRIVGFEALMRWNSKEHGAIAPSTFIPLAEETGLIVPMGRWALICACEQLRKWQDAFPEYDDLTLAVNVSMRQLFQEGFFAMAREIVERSGIYPNALELEITETAAMSNPQQTVEVLAQLKQLGVRVALDDFGTGYSSLSHLQKLPIDVVKIDRAFVGGVSRRREGAEIARLVVALARTLNIVSVAEGVETREDLELLKLIGADIGQGFLFSRPMAPDEVEAMLKISGSFVIA